VTLDPDTCYRALRARDRRFDGVFYVAVRTTGIYCRPICPARTPGRDRCEFFERAAEAERRGYRACFRCRPELAPGLAPVDAVPRLVRDAAARIEAGYLDSHSIEELAAQSAVSSRHLRRAMEAELGVAPIQLAQTRRLAFAKRLLQDTAMPLADLAFAAGYASVRRFDAAFQERFRRPPLAWGALLDFLGARALPGVETVAGGEYRRMVTLGERSGSVTARHDPRREPGVVRVRVSLSLAPRLVELASRLRSLFDLDAHPAEVDSHLREDRRLRPLVHARPGLRVPGAFDGFETAVRAVLGQQVSVAAPTTLAGRLLERFGSRDPAFFPGASVLASSSVERIAAIGLPRSRASTILSLARAVADETIVLSPTGEPDAAIAALRRLPGIGPWTAQYLAMRVLRWPDAFPAGDLGVKKALRVRSEREALARAEHLRPWRAYAAMHF
jgi:AraC family transcriptional regulator of adaptative response / DNA-3-methyladenine glycosylase II